MKIILLDIDGAMVHGHSWESPEILSDGFSAFSKVAVKALNEIIYETGAIIVLTTSHKSRYGLIKWGEILKARGIKGSFVLGRLPEGGMCRKDGIIDYLTSHLNITSYVIIDDDKSLNDLPDDIKRRLISLNNVLGTDPKDVDKAIRILNNYFYHS